MDKRSAGQPSQPLPGSRVIHSIQLQSFTSHLLKKSFFCGVRTFQTSFIWLIAVSDWRSLSCVPSVCKWMKLPLASGGGEVGGGVLWAACWREDGFQGSRDVWIISICGAAEEFEVKAQLQSRVARAEKVAIKYCASGRKEEMEEREKQAAEKRRRH